MRFRPGIVIMDILIGTIIVVMVGGLLTYSVAELNATTRRLAHSRNLLRRQQAMLYSAMAGHPPGLAAAGGHLQACPVNPSGKSSSPPRGYQWVFVTSKSKYAVAHRLYALVPQVGVSVKPGGQQR